MTYFFRAICILLFFWGNNPAFGQPLQAVVADQVTHQPIPDVFVFLANSSIGAATEEDGSFQLDLTETKAVVLVFSHINYELQTLEVADVSFFRDTVFLKPIQLELTGAEVVEQSRAGLRKRRLKTFYQAFFGADTDEKQIRLINPEVLLFEEKKGRLTAEAGEPLIIENRQLGYTIQFYLEAFELYDNDDLFYKGNTFFQTMAGAPEEQAGFEKNRREVYRKSSRRFFSQLVRQEVDSASYLIGFAQLDQNGGPVDFTPVSPGSLLIRPRPEGAYEIIIHNFLTVIDQHIQVGDTRQMALAPNLGPGMKNVEIQDPEFATSYIRSRSNRILVNRYGKILNPSDLQEYGYWAELRVAALLPSDYAPED